MYDAMKWIHIIGGIALLFYVAFPFRFFMSTKKLSGVFVTLNRIGQYLLIVGFVTGGYLIGQVGDYEIGWLVAVIVLLLVMFAMTGMMTKPMKKAASGETLDGAAAVWKKLRIFGTVNAVAYLIIYYLMESLTR